MSRSGRRPGIEIVPVAATVAKLLAMFRSGQMEIDLIDTGDDTLLQLDIAGALMPLDYKAFKFTNPDDLDPAIKRKAQVGNFVYAMVMGYHTSAYPKGKEPKSWAEFWDIKAFPGPRTMPDMASGAPNLEFALIADGVPMEKVYPIDIDRAFKAMSRVRPAVHEILGHRRALDADAGRQGGRARRPLEHARSGRHRQGRAARRPVESEPDAGAVLRHPEGLENVRGGANSSSISASAPTCSRTGCAPTRRSRSTRRPIGATAPELIDPEPSCPGPPQGFNRNIEWWAENRSQGERPPWSQAGSLARTPSRSGTRRQGKLRMFTVVDTRARAVEGAGQRHRAGGRHASTPPRCRATRRPAR